MKAHFYKLFFFITIVEMLYFFYVTGQSEVNFTSCKNGSCDIQSGSDLPDEIKDLWRSSIVRVINDRKKVGKGMLPRGVIELGSGVIIQDREGDRHVLSAAHLFRDGVGDVTIQDVFSVHYRVHLVEIDSVYDLALLKILDGCELPPMAVCKKFPEAGDEIRVGGYGKNGQLKIISGVIKGYVPTSEGTSFETIKFSGAVRQGDSGGPVYNKSGEIVGIVWGTDGRDSYATYNGRICELIRKMNDDITDRSNSQNSEFRALEQTQRQPGQLLEKKEDATERKTQKNNILQYKQSVNKAEQIWQTPGKYLLERFAETLLWLFFLHLSTKRILKTINIKT